MDKKILFKFASRGRPEKLFAKLDNIFANVTNWAETRILLSIDSNDVKYNIPDVLQRLKQYPPELSVVVGHSRNKIDAINRDVQGFEWPWEIIIAESDDMEIVAAGVDSLIRLDFEAVEASYTKDAILMHYEDGYPHGKIVSWPVMNRKYYERFGFIYNPVYISLFCDEELYLVGKWLKLLYHSSRHLVKHQHPMNTGAGGDAQLKHTQSFHDIDKRTFINRKAKNFYITQPKK